MVKSDGMTDLIDMKFGRLTVIDYAGTHITPCGTRKKLWKCVCDCGKEKTVCESNLKNGSTKSCGCLKTERIVKHNTKHSGSKDRLYGIWKNMKRRCHSPKDSHYKTYGEKGVRVCDEWNCYEVFKEWAYANGYKENADYGECTIDRINNDGDYEPSNCRFVNRIAQANNTSRNRFVEFEGKRLTIAEFARAMNIDKNHAWYYIDKFERGLTNG